MFVGSEGLRQHSLKTLFGGVTKFINPEYHVQLPLFGISPIRAKNKIPPGKIKTKIAVRFDFF